MERKKIRRILPLFLAFWSLGSVYAAAAELVPVGEAVGIVLDVKGVYVEELQAFEGEKGRVSPAEKAGILPGDLLVKAAGRELSDAGDLAEAVRDRAGEAIPAEILRTGRRMILSVTPEKDAGTGKERLGILARETQSGIGTVTWYDPVSGVYGALGHGIHAARSDPGSLDRGELYKVTLTGLEKGAPGKAGELKGSLVGEPVGSAEANTPFGVYGVAPGVFSGETAKTLSRAEIRKGKAEILATLENGKTGRYEIEILGVESAGDPGRAISFRVTDPELLEKTGGVIRGMSGSPILQDGKLAGGVTHVLISDPKTGYGIPVDAMIAEAERLLSPLGKAA